MLRVAFCTIFLILQRGGTYDYAYGNSLYLVGDRVVRTLQIDPNHEPMGVLIENLT